MVRAIFGLSALVLVLGLPACEIKECDDCFDDAGPDSDTDTDTDTDVDTDTDTDTDTGTDTGTGTATDVCDSASWDAAYDDFCVDNHQLRTCETDLLVDLDCGAICMDEFGQDGRCSFADDRGYICKCSGSTCDVGTPDECINGDTVRKCVDGLAISVPCQAWCQTTEDADGLCNEDPEVDTCECY